MSAHAKRLLYLVHRWTGIGGCILMLLWTVSGVVMLYVGYPRLLAHERLAPLPVLDAWDCCVPVEAALAQARAPQTVRGIRLSAIAGAAQYRLEEADGRFTVVDARTGQLTPTVDEAAALAGARAFLPGVAAHPQGTTQDDRWTHGRQLDAHRPMFIVQMDDAQRTRLYVSSTTGEVVMDAPQAQRRWNNVGAWLHWLYMFREGSRDPVWTWTLVALSAAATVSAVTGAVAGIWRWRFRGRYKSGAKTPYRDFNMRWHHVTGLVFGLVLIAWAFSGLASMNPAGVFDPKGARPDLAAWRGGVPGTTRVEFTTGQALTALREAGFAARELEWKLLGGEAFVLARDGEDRTRVIEATPAGPLVRERWDDAALLAVAPRLFTDRLLAHRPLDDYDAFYYRRGASSMYGGAERRLPVLALDFADVGGTRVYADPFTGEVALSVDRSQRVGRWLFNLLHSWDLPSMLQAGLARELVLIVLSIGVLAVALTGTVIGLARLRRITAAVVCKPVVRRETTTGCKGREAASHDGQ